MSDLIPAAWKPFEQAAQAGLAKAGIYPHAHPGSLVMTAILSGLEEAGLLVTEARLEEIAAVVEEIDLAMPPAQVRQLAVEAIRSGGAAL